MLHVSDLAKSTAHYRKIFGMEVSTTKNPNRVWFGVAQTRLGLEAAAAGEKPSIYYICLRVAGFDRKTAPDKLKRIGVEVLPADDAMRRHVRYGLEETVANMQTHTPLEWRLPRTPVLVGGG